MIDNKLNNNYFKKIFNTAKIGIIITDDKLKIINSNNEAINIFQYTSEELYGKDIQIILTDENLSDIIC